MYHMSGSVAHVSLEDAMPNKTLHRIAPLGVLIVLVALSAAELGSFDWGECIEPAARLRVHETTTITIEEPTWLFMETYYDHAYRLDVSGPDGANLERWQVFYESGGYCFYSGQPIAEQEISGGTAAFEWSSYSYYDDVLRVTPADPGKQDSSLTLSLSELAAPPPGIVQVIPAVAHTAGVGGTFFQTDLRLFNFRDEPLLIELVLMPSGGPEQRFNVTVEPQQILALDDVVLTTFGRDASTGALRLHSSGWGVIAISRTYNLDTESGTLGQFVAPQFWGRAAGGGNYDSDDHKRTLLHLAKSEHFRSNVGFVEVLGLDAELALEMFDDSGALIASGKLSLAANSHRQINDVFGFLGAPAGDHASLTVSLTDTARFFTYASVVDNLSADPIFVPGLGPADAHTDLIVVAAAAVSGSLGSRWRTDLRVLALDDANWLRISFLPSDGSQPTTSMLPFSGGLLAIDDVVGSLGRSGSGALFVRSNADILVTSRTYDVTANGTVGQFIPAQSEHRGFISGTVLGVARSSDYRTNVGMLNPNQFSAVDVVVSLVSETGSLLGSATWSLEPLRHIQINDIFSALNVAWRSNCRVHFRVTDGMHGVFAYASKIDKRSGDPVLVPATATIYGLAPTIEVSNRDNAFLIDELPEAVGLAALPAGTLTATLSGSGNLGRPDLPIQVLCLYKSPVGELRSTVLAIGESLSDIGGGERFWCVIPDWISAQDNTGEVTVTLTGGADDLELTLDAAANAVLLDDLEESVVAVQPPAEAYQVEVTGDLGRPELAPQVVVMYRDGSTGQLRVRALVDGDVFDDIATDFQILVVIVDWLNRDDNTGTTRLQRACTTRSGACNTAVSGTLADSDCQASPLGAGPVGEAINFDGSAGQAVTITVNWVSGWPGYVHLVDPSDNVIAADLSQDEPSHITVTLPETGTYLLWVSAYTSQEYVAEITCEEP